MQPSVAIANDHEQLEDPLAYLPFATIVEYPKGRTIYSQDQVSTTLYLVMDGRVNVSRLSENGRQVVVDIHQTDDFFGESAFLKLPHRPEQATALENTRLMSWTMQALTDLMIRRPNLAIALLQVLAQRTTMLKERIESFSADSIGSRLARSLIRFALRAGTAEEGGGVRLAPFTHELLSQYVGTSREVVTHYMNRLKRQGCLQYSRKSMTVHPVALRRWLNEEMQHVRNKQV
jgi:CRP/FNR family transcriptional regulator, cyclic AMP receptor protein